MQDASFLPLYYLLESPLHRKQYSSLPQVLTIIKVTFKCQEIIVAGRTPFLKEDSLFSMLFSDNENKFKQKTQFMKECILLKCNFLTLKNLW